MEKCKFIIKQSSGNLQDAIIRDNYIHGINKYTWDNDNIEFYIKTSFNDKMNFLEKSISLVELKELNPNLDYLIVERSYSKSIVNKIEQYLNKLNKKT